MEVEISETEKISEKIVAMACAIEKAYHQLDDDDKKKEFDEFRCYHFGWKNFEVYLTDDFFNLADFYAGDSVIVDIMEKILSVKNSDIFEMGKKYFTVEFNSVATTNLFEFSVSDKRIYIQVYSEEEYIEFYKLPINDFLEKTLENYDSYCLTVNLIYSRDEKIVYDVSYENYSNKFFTVNKNFELIGKPIVTDNNRIEVEIIDAKTLGKSASCNF